MPLVEYQHLLFLGKFPLSLQNAPPGMFSAAALVSTSSQGASGQSIRPTMSALINA